MDMYRFTVIMAKLTELADLVKLSFHLSDEIPGAPALYHLSVSVHQDDDNIVTKNRHYPSSTYTSATLVSCGWLRFRPL